jgi:hypothetical protein
MEQLAAEGSGWATASGPTCDAGMPFSFLKFTVLSLEACERRIAS